MIALIVILGIINFIAWIWLIVIAFKKNAGWGLLVFLGSIFFAPIPAIIFAAMNWEAAKKAFLVYIISTVLIIIFAFNFIVEMVQVAMETEQQQQSGEISEQEAQRRMLELLGMDVPPELREEVVDTTVEEEITKLTESLEQAGTEQQAEPEPVIVTEYKPILLSQVKNYVGQEIRITTVNGVEKPGMLKEVRYNSIVMTRAYRGGDFTFEVLNRTIAKIEVLEIVEN